MDRNNTLPEGRKKKKKNKSKKKKKKRPLDTAAIELAAENAKRELIGLTVSHLGIFSKLIIEFLLTKTELSEEELLKAYDDFHEKYPEGEINKTQFLAQSKVSPLIARLVLKFPSAGRQVHCLCLVPSV